jgi:hypothetical protein
VASSHAAGWTTVAQRSQPGARRRRRFSVAQLRAIRRVLGVVVIVEVAILGARLLDTAGFNSKLTLATMTLLAANVLASWGIIAHANRGLRQRRYRHSRA